MNRTVEKKDTSSITIRTTGHEKSSFTVVLACTASGRKLPPMMIFKRKTAIKEKLPSGVIVHNNEKGWMDNNVMDQERILQVGPLVPASVVRVPGMPFWISLSYEGSLSAYANL
jgi:hypothetical protein